MDGHKALLFDLGKVLISFDFSRGYRALEGRCAYPASEIAARIAPTGLVESFETGLIEPLEFYSGLSRTLGLNMSYEEFQGAWNGIFTETLIPESLLEALSARYRLVLLSNTNRIHFEMLERTYPFLRHFHEKVLSYEVRAMKPDPKIYHAAIERAGCQPGECFYVDDIPAYAEAARRLGIDAVRFESLEGLERDLTARGICY